MLSGELLQPVTSRRVLRDGGAIGCIADPSSSCSSARPSRTASIGLLQVSAFRIVRRGPSDTSDLGQLQLGPVSSYREHSGAAKSSQLTFNRIPTGRCRTLVLDPSQAAIMTTEATARAFFSSPFFAVVGASNNPAKYGHKGEWLSFNASPRASHSALPGTDPANLSTLQSSPGTSRTRSP